MILSRDSERRKTEERICASACVRRACMRARTCVLVCMYMYDLATQGLQSRFLIECWAFRAIVGTLLHSHTRRKRWSGLSCTGFTGTQEEGAQDASRGRFKPCPSAPAAAAAAAAPTNPLQSQVTEHREGTLLSTLHNVTTPPLSQHTTDRSHAVPLPT